MINPAVRNSIRGSGRQAYPHQVARALPRAGLLLYLGRPNLEAADVPLGDDTEIGDDTIIRWKFILPADADIRAATGWVSGAGNIFYDAAGDPIDVFASEIAVWADINRYNVLFHLVSADTETGRLAIYALDADHATLNKARRALREDQYDYWAPLGAILHYDAGVSPLTELVGGVHALNYSVLGPQYQRLADGSVIDVGNQPAVDVLPGGIKGLRTCGALTNLFPGDTSVARAVTLTSQAYTLQVLGAGSISCIYGTATVGSPLTFAATAGTITFTPSGATLWILTATAYPTPYVPSGVTQPASNATATNGAWFALPDGSELRKALDGEPYDALPQTPIWAWAPTAASERMAAAGNTITAVSSLSNDVARISNPVVAFTQNDRVRVRYKITNYSGGTFRLLIYASGYVGVGTNRLSNGEFAEDIILSTASSSYTQSINVQALVGGSATIELLSIQRIQPQPFTLAIRIPMGVGSADLPNGSVLNICTPDDVAGRFLTVQKSAAGALTANLNDGTNNATITLEAWSRGAILDFYPQVVTAANQMQIGYKVSTDANITWGSTSTYDGSFGPDVALSRFMLGYNNTYPQRVNRLTAWKRQVPTTELEAWA